MKEQKIVVFVFNEEKTSLFSLISVPQMKAWKMLTLGPNSLYLTVTRNLQTAFSQSYTLIPSYWGQSRASARFYRSKKMSDFPIIFQSQLTPMSTYKVSLGLLTPQKQQTFTEHLPGIMLSTRQDNRPSNQVLYSLIQLHLLALTSTVLMTSTNMITSGTCTKASVMVQGPCSFLMD